MTSFFRVNDPLRIIGLFVFMLLMWLPFFLWGYPSINNEIKWLALGEMLGEGGIMYKDVFDNTAPLTSGLYWLFDMTFGKKSDATRISAFAILFFQAIQFNFLMSERGIYNEKTYLPAFFYLLCSYIAYDGFTLNPVLLALTPLLLLLRNIFQAESIESDDNIFTSGVFIGIAVLFYPPSIVFLIFFWLSLAFFRTMEIKYFVLSILGFSLIFFFAFSYYYIVGAAEGFYLNFIFASLALEDYHLLDFGSLFLIGAVPLSLLVYAAFRTFALPGFINFQSNCQRVLLIWAAGAFLAFFLTQSRSAYHFMLFLPPLAFFLAHWVLSVYKKWQAELLLLGIVAYFAAFKLDLGVGEKYVAFARPDYSKVEGKSNVDKKGQTVLVLGNNYGYYRYNRNASPYLNWQLSKSYFEDLDDYGSVLSLFDNFSQYKPEVLVDEEGVLPEIFKKMPLLGKNYTVNPKDSTFYYLKKENFVDAGTK